MNTGIENHEEIKWNRNGYFGTNQEKKKTHKSVDEKQKPSG